MAASGLREIDRWDGGVGWIANPGERLERASHALAADGGALVVDPVDAQGLDELLETVGPVSGVVVLLDRHVRDVAAIAERHEVPVYLHETLAGVATGLDVPVEPFEHTLPGTEYRAVPVVTNRFWREVALLDERAGTLVVPEAVGTASYYLTGPERLGVHPALRLRPPRRILGGLEVERVLVGHGQGVQTEATLALDEALAGARRRAPGLYLETAKSLLGLG